MCLCIVWFIYLRSRVIFHSYTYKHTNSLIQDAVDALFYMHAISIGQYDAVIDDANDPYGVGFIVRMGPCIQVTIIIKWNHIQWKKK